MQKLFIAAIILLASCSSSNKTMITENLPLENTKWILMVLNNKKVFIPESGKEIYIQFQKKDNKANGNAGCNNFFGDYSINNDEIKFGPIARTEMFCELQMTTENNFIKALEQTVRYKIKGSNLYFYDNVTLLARFEAVRLN